MGKKLLFVIFVLCLLSSLLFGCYIHNIKPLSNNLPTQTNHIYKKNYELGHRQSVNVGEAMIRVKDYYVKIKKKPAMSPDNDFITSGGFVTIKGYSNNTYPLVGTVDYEGNELNVLKIKDTNDINRGLVITKHGHVKEKVLSSPDVVYSIYKVYEFTTKPPDVKFSRTTEEEIISKSGYTNYKIIYTGQTDKYITLSYREFTPENLARPAFTQRLTFSKDSNVIQFKDLKIKIHYSTNQKIEYSVLEDGHSS